MKYPPFAAMANILIRAAKQEDALRMSTELGHHITPAPTTCASWDRPKPPCSA